MYFNMQLLFSRHNWIDSYIVYRCPQCKLQLNLSPYIALINYYLKQTLQHPTYCRLTKLHNLDLLLYTLSKFVFN